MRLVILGIIPADSVPTQHENVLNLIWVISRFRQEFKMCASHESWQPVCWANSISWTFSMFGNTRNFFMQIFYERCCWLLGPQLNYMPEAVFRRFHQFSSTLCLRWPALILWLSGSAWTQACGNIWILTGQPNDFWTWCLWLVSSDAGLLSLWRCPCVTQTGNVELGMEKTASRHWVSVGHDVHEICHAKPTVAALFTNFSHSQ